MKNFIKGIVTLLLALSLISCATPTTNKYGLPIDQWNSLTPKQQAYIKKTHTNKSIPAQPYQRFYIG